MAAAENSLREYAKPFDVELSIAMSGEQTISIRHHVYGYAKREIPQYILISAQDTFTVFFKAIDEMKAELTKSAAPSDKPSLRLDYTAGEAIAYEEIQKVQKLDLPKKTSRRPECPMHHNFMIPSDEVGVLYCPVAGCKKKMRKKVKEDSSVTIGSGSHTANAVYAESDAEFPVAQMEDEQVIKVSDPEQPTPAVAEDPPTLAPTFRMFRSSDGKMRTPEQQTHYNEGRYRGFRESQTVTSGYNPNYHRPRLEKRPMGGNGERTYLVQGTGNTEVWIDVTEIVTEIEYNTNPMNPSQILETILTLQI